MTQYLELYRHHVLKFKQTRSGREYVGSCPFPSCKGRTDQKFYVNSQTGQYHCKICSASGNAITFARYFGDNPQPFYDQPPNPTKIDLEKVAESHKNLLARPERWREPWKSEVLELLQVGWDERRHKLVFPIFDTSGNIINLIVHKSHQMKNARVTLYPAHLIEKYDPAYLVICEGLTDCISLLSIDIQVVSSTGGALSIPMDISALRKFKRIYLCFDFDEAGETGCDQWISRLLSEMDR